MDLRYTPEELAFRDEVRDFLRDNLPDDIRQRLVDGEHGNKDDLVAWSRILNAHGWAVPHWPVEWGGRDWSELRRHIWYDEMQRAGVPTPLPFNTSMIGPVLAGAISYALSMNFSPSSLLPIATLISPCAIRAS